MKGIVLVEAPSNLGLAEPSPGVEPGVRFFPAAMEKAGFELSIRKEKSQVDIPAYSTDIDPETRVRNTGKIIEFSRRLANEIQTIFQRNESPVVLGGDCSVLIGPALALKRRGDYGLFFLDGHTDYVTPQQSGSAGAAGMDLAIVAGKGHEKLTNMENLEPYFGEENIFCCGNRELTEAWYVDEIKKSRIHYFDLFALRKKGMDKTVKEFVEMVIAKKLAGLWIHFDVDVLDDRIMPCVDSRQEDGLSYSEMHQVLRPLIESEYFHGIDISIFDPTLDKEGTYAKQLAAELNHLFATH